MHSFPSDHVAVNVAPAAVQSLVVLSWKLSGARRLAGANVSATLCFGVPALLCGGEVCAGRMNLLMASKTISS